MVVPDRITLFMSSGLKATTLVTLRNPVPNVLKTARTNLISLYAFTAFSMNQAGFIPLILRCPPGLKSAIASTWNSFFVDDNINDG